VTHSAAFGQLHKLSSRVEEDDDDDLYIDNARLPGFIGSEELMQIIMQLGRDGLTFEGYQKFMAEFQLDFSHSEVHDSFVLTDVNQDGILSFNKFMSGFYILVKNRFPERVIGRLGLSEAQIFRFVVGTVIVFAGVFCFLFLATLTLSGGDAFDLFAQCCLTVGAAMFVSTENAGGKGPDVYRELMLDDIGLALHIPHAMVKKIRKRIERGEIGT
jgi:hypothetical protein